MLSELDLPSVRSTHVALEHLDHMDYAIVLAHTREQTASARIAPARARARGPRRR